MGISVNLESFMHSQKYSYIFQDLSRALLAKENTMAFAVFTLH